MNGTIRKTRRLGRTPWAFAHVLLLCVFVWNQYYIPVHLAAHDHTGVHGTAFGAFGTAHHDDDDDHEDDHHDDHEAHPASDHLSGYIAHGHAEIVLDASFVSAGAVFVAPLVYRCTGLVPAPPARGPPAFSPLHS